ncbi:uncharacterized protein [Halyomorpha halys]|uniref:uncharacterized protein n=1 Tax=Halyomorpha halys TaxID=286706 RepID=UPI0006D516AC
MFGMYEVLFISIIILKVMVSCSISVYRLPSIHIPCYEDDNCNFGMLCSKNRTCICSRLYDWNEELKQCQLNLQELGLWLSSLKEETDLKENMKKSMRAFLQRDLTKRKGKEILKKEMQV